MSNLSFTKRPAFTLIELVIVLSIIALLAAVLLANFTTVRRTARDGVRKAGVQTLLQALEADHSVTGSYLVTVRGEPCAFSGGNAQSVPVGTGAGCTGASGDGFGPANWHSAPAPASPLTVPSTVHPGLTYVFAQTSITQALQQDGFLGTVPRDPLAGDLTTGASPDYVIVACCVGGKQRNSGNGQYVSVIASLEAPPSLSDSSNTANYCGGANQLPSSGYQFDYAMPPSLLSSNLYILGTGSPKSGQAQLDTCRRVDQTS